MRIMWWIAGRIMDGLLADNRKICVIQEIKGLSFLIILFSMYFEARWRVLLGTVRPGKEFQMKKYYIESWSVTIGWILFLSIIDAYLYFGIPDSNKTIILVTWLIGVTIMLAVTITCNIVKRKNNEK